MDTRPFYPHSFSEAKRNEDQKSYVLSHSANIDCKKAIEKAISDQFDGHRLGADVAKGAIKEFGIDRVQYVLANSIKHKDHDGRISRENKLWAKETFVPLDKFADRDRTLEFAVDQNGLLDIVVNQFKRAYKALNLWDQSQVNPPTDVNFEGKVLVLNPEMLNEQHKTRDEQLFYAVGGFGCFSDKGNKKVMGCFLLDGEQTNFYRFDFLGEAKSELLPQWAKEKLAEKEQSRKPSVLQQLKETKEQAKQDKPMPLKEQKKHREDR